MIDRDFKAKWLAALRSGEYKKTTGMLYDGVDSYCCLGVACVVGGVKDPTQDGGMKFAYGTLYDEEGKYLGEADRNGFGMDRDTIVNVYGKNDDVLTGYGKDTDFIRMADWLEKNI